MDNNDMMRKIFDDIFGSNDPIYGQPKPEKKEDTAEFAKPLFDIYSDFVSAGFTEEQAIDLVKFMIVTAYKMNK